MKKSKKKKDRRDQPQFKIFMAKIEQYCNSDPYTSGEIEAVMTVVEEFTDKLVKISGSIPKRSLPPLIRRLSPLLDNFKEIGGPYSSTIASSLDQCISDLKRQEKVAA